MKTLYTLVLFLGLAGFANAQSAVRGCTTETGLMIWFNVSMNCPEAPGDIADVLTTYDTLGFHSGVNSWAVTVPWDAPQAQTTAGGGGGYGGPIWEYAICIDNLEDYYGTTGIETVNFVYNQGFSNPGEPWGAEGKDVNPNGGCTDFTLLLADLETCPPFSATQDVELTNTVSIAPNPFTDFTIVSIDNPRNKTFDISLNTVSGQTVKVIRGFTGEQIEISRDDLIPGLYFLNIMDNEGRFTTKKLVVR